MSEAPTVTVVIPTFNRAYCLAETIKSVIGQSFVDFELVVVDDGSTDDTAGMLATRFNDSRLQYVHQDNAGVSAARNTGMRLARGKYVAFCDSDDLWDPWKLAVQVAAMERFPSAGICWTDLAAISPSGQMLHSRFTRVAYRTWERKPIDQIFESTCTLSEIDGALAQSVGEQHIYFGNIFSTMIVGTIINMPTVMIARSVCATAGEFDTTMVAGEDYDFNLRVCASCPAIFVDMATIKYRVGAADQLTRPELMIDQARNSLRTVLPFVTDRSATKLTKGEIAAILAERYRWLGEAELEAGHLQAARSALLKSLSNKPTQARIVALALTTLLPQFLTDKLRGLYQRAKGRKAATTNA